MASVLLHVGAGKTGTSTVQQLFSSHREQLAAAGWVYPQIGVYAHHSLVPMIFQDRDWARRGDSPVSTDEGHAQVLATVTEVFDTQVEPGSRWLLSSEYFGSLNRAELVTPLVDYLHRWFDDIGVVMYVRRQDYLLPSLFSESMRTWGLRGGAASRRVQASDEISADNIKSFAGLLDYRRILTPWVDALPAGAITVRPYLEGAKSNPNWIPGDIQHLMGIDANTVVVDPAARSQSLNESLTAEGIAIIRATAPLVLDVTTNGISEAATANPWYPLIQPCVVRRPDGSVYYDRPRFTDFAVTHGTGGRLIPTPELCQRMLGEFAEANAWARSLSNADVGWQDWFDQPIPSRGVTRLPTITDQRRDELISLMAREDAERISRQAARKAPAPKSATQRLRAALRRMKD